MQITPLGFDDLPRLAEIEKICFGADAWNYGMLKSEMDGGAVFLGAVSGGETVGYICARLIIDEADINNVAVVPEFRRRGVASALIDGLKDYCLKRGINRFTLEVNVNNRAAKSLYARARFVSVGIRKGYYHGEDAEIMWLTEESDGENHQGRRI